MYRNIILLSLLVIFQGCQKEEYNLPADVYLQFHEGAAFALEGDLQFNSFHMFIL